MKSSRAQKFGILLLIIIFIVILFGLLILKPENVQTGKMISPILDIVEKENESKLPNIFNNNFKGVEDGYAVVIKNLKTGEAYKHNEDKQFNSASLYKLWVLAVAKDQIEKGMLGEDEVLRSEKQKLDDLLSGKTPTPAPQGFVEPSSVEKEKISIDTKTAMEKMITTSDNYSAILLSNRVGVKNINDFLDNNNFDNSDYGIPPKTTAGDIANFFELLYKRKFVNSRVSNEMIEILKAQSLNDRIPKYLPGDIEIAHKTGELQGIKHDAGIVFNNTGGDYIIVVLSDTDNKAVAAEKIAKFSEDVFKYFRK